MEAKYNVYRYLGSFRNGIKRKGIVVADTKEDAIAMLRTKGIYVTRLRKIPDFIVSRYKAKPADLALMFNGFAKMTKAEISFEVAIENLINEQISPAISIGLYKMLKAARDGHPIYKCFKRSGLFPEDIISIIEAGNKSGKLVEVYNNLYDFYVQQSMIRKAIIGALSYPAVVVAMSLLMLIFLAPKILEPIKGFFAYTGMGELPAITVIMMSLVDFVKSYGIFVVAGIFLFTKLFIDTYKANESFKHKVDYFFIRLPFYGEFIEKMSVFRFILSLSILYEAGVPVADALVIAARTQPNEAIKDDYMQVVNLVGEGDKLSRAIRQSFYMPDIAKTLITIGERSGQLEEQLKSLREFSKESFAEYVKKFNKILQPVTIVIVGLFIMALLISVYLPMFSIIDAVKG